MIKLFGMTICSIPNKEEDIVSTADFISSHHDHLSSSTTTTTTSINTKDPTQSNNEESIGMDDEEFTVPERRAPTILSEISEEPETSSGDKESLLPNSAIEKDALNDTSKSDEQTLDKPDKLVPCPRCSSMDTKFCYYNNYNVSQPRHFCKSCQRYWTAGGTMRSVPVGSGRRKNKCSPASRYRQIIVTEALHAAAAQACATNGSLLAFGSDSSQCKNMSCATIQTAKPEIHVRSKCFEETHDDNSSGSSSTVLNPNEKVFGAKPKLKNIQDSPIQLPCFPVPPWASSWNTAEWRSATQRPSFYPTPPYWGCPAPNPWNMAWLSPHCSSGELSVRSPASNSQILGKHSRDESNIGSTNPEEKPHLGEGDLKRGVLTPKTLRIHDPIEAAQSCMWSTLGIKNEHIKPVNEANLLEAFRAKGVERYHMTKAAMVLQANPAALHRSYNFLETA